MDHSVLNTPGVCCWITDVVVEIELAKTVSKLARFRCIRGRVDRSFERGDERHRGQREDEQGDEDLKERIAGLATITSRTLSPPT